MKKLPARGWDWPSVLLLIMLMTTASARLWITNWTPNLGLAQTAVVLGCALGLTLGFSLFQRRAVWLLAVGYTLVSLPWLWLKVIESEESAWQRLASVGGRLLVAIEEIATRRPVEDFIFFVALMTTLFWLIGLYSGYQLTRKGNLLAAIIPAGLGIVIIELYDLLEPERTLYLGMYLLLSLILLGRQNLLKNNATWQTQNMAVSSDLKMELSTSIVVAALVLLIGAWLMPFNGLSFAPVERAWHALDAEFEATRERIKDALAAVQNYIPSSSGGTGYGAEMSLGLTAAQGTAILFDVEVSRADAQRYYWRARVYDTYANGRWSNAGTSNKIYRPDDKVPFVPQDVAADQAGLVFIIKQPQATLLTSNEPLWISREATATFGYTGTTVTDLITLRASNMVRSGERYEVQSAVRSPTISALRAAGTDYPGWLEERYLQLPYNFPIKIKRLAEEITANAATPYDKAAAITRYLRATITYTETIRSTDPLGGDPVAWMLFNSQEGFCNYYASAEVLMLRAVGIPARLAVGYAEGEKTSTASYEVRNRDSHAWPEVYFPGLGWVEFEPTSAQPALTRPSGETTSALPGGVTQPTQPADDGTDRGRTDDENTPVATDSQLSQRLFLWVIIFIVGSAIVAGLVYLNRRMPFSVRLPRALIRMFMRYQLSVPRWLQDWLRWTELTSAERAFETINRCLWILGKPQPIHATPSERAAALSSLLPEAAPAIEQLTQQHIGALFSPVTSSTRRAWRTTLSIYILTLRRYFRSVR